MSFDHFLELTRSVAREDTYNHYKLYLYSAFDHSTPTGLEELPTNVLISMLKRRETINRRNVLLSSWDTLIDFPILSEWWQKKLQLEQATVLEIGVGPVACEHENYLKEKYGVKSYKAVDIIRYPGAIQSDALEFLERQPDEEYDAVFVFGLFNEPLALFAFQKPVPMWFQRFPLFFTRFIFENQLKWEYNRRLFHQISRVTKKNGYLCGTGLQDGGIAVGGWENADLILENGFVYKAGFINQIEDTELLDKLRQYIDSSPALDDLDGYWMVKTTLGTFLFIKSR